MLGRYFDFGKPEMERGSIDLKKAKHEGEGEGEEGEDRCG
jgi:hypothetical protein